MKETKQWGKFSRWAAVGTLSLSLLLGHVIPVKAEGPVTVPQISPWSVSTLNEGEKYGIFPPQWYMDGTFQKAITADKFNSLMSATATKLDQLGFKKKDSTLSVVHSGKEAITRESVITSFYKLLTNYELPETFAVTTDTSLDYMQKQGIVQGNGSGLGLSNPSTVEQAAVIATRLIEFAYDKADSGAEGLMWKVTNEKNTLYLFGSIHAGITDMYPMHKSVRDAYNTSDELWVEADIVAGDMDYYAQTMLYKEGTSLKDSVSADTYAKLQKVLTKLEIPAETFDVYKPFAISSTLSSLYTYGTFEESQMAQFHGVDRYFLTSALLSAKPVHELEGIKFQADLFASVPAEKQEKELNALLDAFLSDTDRDEAGEQLKQMQLAWVKGDQAGLLKVLTTPEGSAESDTNKLLFGDRDKKMAIKLAELLEREGENTSFVVVGAGHYVQKGLVIDLLKEKGYTVEAMQ